MSDATRPRIVITVGDPRGIGPEIIGKALADPRVRAAATYIVVGPRGTRVAVQESIGDWRLDGGMALAGELSGLAIERAVALVQRGEAHGLVTGPIDKRALLAGGYDYPGHTEMLADLTGAQTAMMLASPQLRVVLATTHIPLRLVPAMLSRGTILDVARLTRDALKRWYGIAEPRIALCALNPHGGDGGRFGTEDDELLAPVARAAQLTGPLPADTVFVRALKGEFDAVIAPYHDVGMTAIKVASFGQAVNLTLGLPFPRTSPDHGTALDIAGQGIADPSSMIAAVLECSRLAGISAGVPLARA